MSVSDWGEVSQALKNSADILNAIWQDEAYAYSIMGTDGITQEEMEQLIESIY